MLKGLKISDIKTGSGPIAEKGKVAVVDYDCYLPRGDRCLTSREDDTPCQFEIGKRSTYAALDKGVVGMVVGGIRSVKVPPQLGYLERHTEPTIPANATLRYEIELLAVTEEWDNNLHRAYSSPRPRGYDT